MHMFVWRSDLLKNYASGHLIAVAHDVEQAREMIRAHFRAWVKENREWWLILDDDMEEFEQGRKALESDLSKEPERVSVLYISGSE